MLVTICFHAPVKAQYLQEYDEVSISLHAEYLGATEIHSVIKNENVFLSIHEVFSFLKILYTISPDKNSLNGFIHHPDDKYAIDLSQRQVYYNNISYTIQENEFINMGELVFLKSNLFGEIFGLECSFNRRDLSVHLSSRTPLPTVKMMLLEQKANKFRMSGLPFDPDTTIGKKAHLFHFGTADWSILATEYSNTQSHIRIGLSIGAIVAGGELTTNLTHTFNRPFSEKQQQYQWRLTNNNSKLVRQFVAGKINIPSISTIYDPIIGIQISNSPSFSRKVFGTYTATDLTIPNALVEIYVNNTLINYTKSDAFGFLTYEIPLSYGSTDVRLRYFAPTGEEQIIIKKFIIPITILPSNEFQYRVSSGIIEDGLGSFFSEGRINYGLTDQITIGGGMEYTGTIGKIQNLPFLNASLKLASNMFANIEYVSNVRYKTSLIYQSPSKLQLEINYTKYEETQEAVKFNYRENRNISISMPFRFPKSSIFTRLSYNQNHLGSQIQNNFESQISLTTESFNINITNHLNSNNKASSRLYGSVATAIPLPARIRLTTRVHFDYTDGNAGSVSIGLEKFLTKDLSASISYEDKFGTKGQYLRFGFQSNLPFGRVSSSNTYSNDNSIYHQSASGSLLYDQRNNYLAFTRNSMIGKGGIVFTSFLDINANGVRDKNENIIPGLNVICVGGSGKKTRTDSSTIITGLEPYIYYGFKADGNYFANISWKILNPALSVSIEPNQIKLVEIPVFPQGEVSGMVNIKGDPGSKQMNRIKINLHYKDSIEVASIITESDGYFSYLGLKPGQYTAQIDPSYLKNAGIKVHPEYISFSIVEDADGAIVDNLLFQVIKE